MGKKSIYTIYETRDYSIFKKLLGNRSLSATRLAAIKDSIIRIGYQPSPILVNEKMEVIDGQGRLAACEALSLPVYYVVKKGLSIDDCISMNMKMENWKDKDFIHCYAEKKYPAYICLRNDLEEFKGLNWFDLLVIKGRGGKNGQKKEILNQGRLQYTSLDYVEREIARWAIALKPHIKEAGLHSSTALGTLIRLNRYGLIDAARMLESFEKYGAKFGANSPRARDTLQFINEIYNYNRVKTVYFADKYRQAAEAAVRKANKEKKPAARAQRHVLTTV